MNENTRVQLDKAMNALQAARRSECWLIVEAEARYVALIARRMRLEESSGEDGIVAGLAALSTDNPPPDQAA